MGRHGVIAFHNFWGIREKDITERVEATCGDIESGLIAKYRYNF
ncbi:hypothetical protein Esi_0027_0107 [Ectocarpus siliculosus]|uniref:Uncharacterized protein n=1 Tax=Ectocarpus siliculosus TaxID=2880 RepID=D7FUE7_ECTSI|nr:hypothetical protein Esi_0027_0107 [Ectocarpus siliculosus]|eukprot:CBJ26217.1 hypothetical protein Esi_0027_0107 [Ectocarpus siliculosus]